VLVSGLIRLPAQTATVPVPDSATRRHVVARRATGRIVLDGKLDESDWRTARVAGDFVTSRPDYKPSAPFASEVRVLFDRDNLYIGVVNRDSAAKRRLRLQDLRRDFEPPENDVFGLTLGPLGDRRTVFQLQTTPLGSQGDVQAFDGGDSFNFAWDALWRVRTTLTDSLWTAEFSIPWRSLRYRADGGPWDVNFVRNNRKLLTWTAWMPYPRQFSSWRLNYGGVLDSLAPPPPGTNVRVRPYVLGTAQRDLAPGAFRGNTGDVGGEVIWAPTTNSVVEATVNTDFAQADVDRQVVNLTRFGVFFPERRQFFLENSDVLSAGGLQGRYVVQPFFTRRIGLADDGTLLPIVGGARYAFRSGRTSAGALAMRQGSGVGAPAATFGVARGSTFFGRSTRLGATLAVRDADAVGLTPASRNLVAAMDGLTRIGETFQMSGMLSTSTAGDATGVAATYAVSYSSPRVTSSLTGAFVTRDYAPQTGFVSRPNVWFTSPFVSYTAQPAWRPKSLVWIRPAANANVFLDPVTRRLQEGSLTVNTEFLRTTGGAWTPFAEANWQRLAAPLALLPGVTIAPQSVEYLRYGLDVRSDQSAAVAGQVVLVDGGFFDGRMRTVSVAGRWSPSPYMALRANYERNAIAGLGTRDTSLVTHLAGPELRLFASPRVQWSAFWQYNSVAQRGSLNARFSWEFSPLSFLYVVYNDRQALAGGVGPRASSLIVKLSVLQQL
jgi:hypothetical protein